MNFNDLYKKIKDIDENVQPVAPVHTDGPAEGECMMPLPGVAMGAAPKQQDNVTMNVSLNGQGAGGVRSLMNILKDIEDGHADHDDDNEVEPIMGDMIAHMAHEQDDPEMGEAIGDDSETWGNSVHGDAGHHIHGVDAVTFSGDDMNSKGKISPLARAPGTNPLQHPMHESLVDRLQSMYEAIKDEDDAKKMAEGSTDLMSH
jgi:hypothetical protein